VERDLRRFKTELDNSGQVKSIGEGAIGLGASARNAMHVVEVVDAGEEEEADGT
jgi:hypothetical protein